MKYLMILYLLFFSLTVFSQKPEDGTYVYDVAFDEWQGKSMGAKVEIEIKGDSIIVRNYENLTGTKGGIIDSGILMVHKKSKQWIVSHNTKDKNAKEVGGCSDGPSVIDFKRKIFWLC